MKVLLVDDEKKFVTMLAKRLKLRGLEAEAVFTGNDAVDMVAAGESYDVAVLDVKMPGIGGIELRRKLQSMDANLKFIFVTGHGSQEDYHVGSSEAAGYLSKPLKIEELISMLQRVTGG